MADRPRWEGLRSAFEHYARGRQALLEAIGVTGSNRDPLSEFSERIVAALLDGELSANRVQRGWDLRTDSGRRVQVKYLANTAGEWINGITIAFGPGEDDPDDFAVVFFEALLPASVMVFPRDGLAAVTAALGKRHPNQDTTLQLTRVNYQRLLTEPATFATPRCPHLRPARAIGGRRAGGRGVILLWPLAGCEPQARGRSAWSQDVGITLDRYSHSQPAMQREAAERLDAILGRNSG